MGDVTSSLMLQSMWIHRVPPPTLPYSPVGRPRGIWHLKISPLKSPPSLAPLCQNPLYSLPSCFFNCIQRYPCTLCLIQNYPSQGYSHPRQRYRFIWAPHFPSLWPCADSISLLEVTRSIRGTPIICTIRGRPLHRYTVYRYTGQQASISEPVWPSIFIWYSFRYGFDKKHSKKARNLCLLQWTVLKKSVLTCKLHASTLLRTCEIVTTLEISCWENVEEAIHIGICSIKQCFYCN